MADGRGMAPRVANFTSGASYLVDGGAATRRYPDVVALLPDGP